MKKIFAIALALGVSTVVFAQGGNTRMGGEDGDYESLSERVLKLEKKSDAFNFYFNYAASGQVYDNGDDWAGRFAAKQFRLEIKGNLTDRLYYRLRHRMNKCDAAKSQDNFAKATDIMMVGYKLNDKLDIMGGKMCQIWGGFEFDENPMYIYQYSDMVDNMDNFMAGVVLSYKPIAGHEFAFEVSNANNGTLYDDFGSNPYLYSTKALIEKADFPLTYIFNWNGSFLDDKLQTRWSFGLQNQAKDCTGKMLVLGQRLNLPRLQWYVDYMGEWDPMDRLGIATSDLSSYLGGCYASDVYYQSFISKLNWQFAPQWNLMVKGTYETASMNDYEEFKNYRTSIGYAASVEYYPAKSQDFRLFLAYVGHSYNFNSNLNLSDFNTNRIELGFMYRIKCY